MITEPLTNWEWLQGKLLNGLKCWNARIVFLNIKYFFRFKGKIAQFSSYRNCYICTSVMPLTYVNLTTRQKEFYNKSEWDKQDKLAIIKRYSYQMDCITKWGVPEWTNMFTIHHSYRVIPQNSVKLHKELNFP